MYKNRSVPYSIDFNLTEQKRSPLFTDRKRRLCFQNHLSAVIPSMGGSGYTPLDADLGASVQPPLTVGIPQPLDADSPCMQTLQR